MSFQSDISKLIFHHLVKEGYESSASNLIRECPHLIELQRVQPPYKLPRLMGPSLVNLIENYFETKENVIEQLELLKSVVFREQDDLQNLNKALVENLKFQTPLTSRAQKETCDASVNTIAFSQDGPQTCDASVNTESANSLPETSDASVNTDSTPKTSDVSCNTDCVAIRPEQCDACVNTEVVFNREKNNAKVSVENSQVSKGTHNECEVPDVIVSPEDVPNQCLSPKSPTTFSTSQNPKDGYDGSVNTAWIHNHVEENSLYCSEQLEASAETIDFSFVYDRLLENREFQEKIAENINKKKAEAVLPGKGSSKRGNLASSQDLDTIIKAIVAETQADPAFDNFLNDCIGIDSEDQTSVGTPDSTAQEEEPTTSHYNEENQENCLVPSNLGAPMVQIVDPSAIASPMFTVQNSHLLDSSSLINGLNSLAFVTSSGSGQITLVPTIISAIPSNAGPSDAGPSDAVEKRKKRNNQPVRRPVAIAPKPFFIISIPPLDNNDQFPNAVGESEFFQQRVEDQQQLVDCNIEKINVESSPAPSTRKPMRVKNRPLAKKSRRKKITKTSDPVIEAPQNPTSSEKFITPGLAALVKIAQEFGSTSMSTQDKEAAREKEPLKSPDVNFDSPVPSSTDFITTPTSTRRLSHVRQLNFGESPELSNKPASSSPVVHPKRSEIPWDLALRNVIAAPPPPDSEIFATPKGKAKRRRKSSPAPLTEIEPVEKTSSIDLVPSTSTLPTIPQQTSTFLSSTPLDQNPVTGTASEPTPRLCDNTDSSYVDLVAASILHEMANTPVIETSSVESSKRTSQENEVQERIVPQPNLSNFGMDIVNREEPIIQQPLPVLETPRKEMVENVGGINSTNSVTHAILCDGQSNSTSFGAWDGEIPRTPQIRLDITNSTSPFQVSLTKGFRFLPTAESPSLPVPATPCIFEVNSSSTSIETPYTGFYQFPSALSTPRLEALRQEIMESPGKSITVISPTQVVLGRPTPYFVPSGERAQGPANQNATPEHVPETEKLERRRRSSTDMDPLQLEESNDASDAAAALMCQAAETVAASLQSPSPCHPPSPLQGPTPLQSPTPHQPSTPYKTDQTLENDLISECRRLEDDPSIERIKLRNERFVELFGEDSTNFTGTKNSLTSVPENVSAVALTQSTPITTKPKTRKPRRTARSKSPPGDESGNSACARVQMYSSSPQTHHGPLRKSERLTNISKLSTSIENENLVQEVLALARVNRSIDSVAPSPLNKRKRRSDSTNRESNGMAELSSEKRSKRKRISSPNVSGVISEEQSLATAMSPTLSPGSSKSDVDIESVSSSPKKSKEDKKTSKEKLKPLKRKATKSNSPEVMCMATRRTPVKLFKSSQPQHGRKRVSNRQSVGVQKSSGEVPNKNNPADTDIIHKERSLELDSVEVVSDLRINTHVEDVVPATVDLNEDDYHKNHSPNQVSDKDTATMETPLNAAINLSQRSDEVHPQLIKEVEKFQTEKNSKETEKLMGIICPETTQPQPISLTQPNITVEDAAVDPRSVPIEKTANDEEDSDDVVMGANRESNCIVLPTLHEGPTSSTCSSVPSNCTENPHEPIISLTSETTLNLCEQILSEEPSAVTSTESSPANCAETASPFLEQKLKVAQKSSPHNAIVSKEIVNQSTNSKLKNYLRLTNLSAVSPKTKNVSVSAGKQGSVTYLESPANSDRQHLKLQQAKIVIHREFVNKVMEELTESEIIDLYSQ